MGTTELLWMVVIGLLEFLQSFFADARTVCIVERGKWRATAFDIIAEGLAWTGLAIIVINRMYFPYILAAIFGNAFGTLVVAGRRGEVGAYMNGSIITGAVSTTRVNSRQVKTDMGSKKKGKKGKKVKKALPVVKKGKKR